MQNKKLWEFRYHLKHKINMENLTLILILPTKNQLKNVFIYWDWERRYTNNLLIIIIVLLNISKLMHIQISM